VTKDASSDAASPAVAIRDAEPADAPALRAIYAHHVLTGLASFEETPPDAAEMERRLKAIVGAGYPYRVAVVGGAVKGYAYASAYRTRPAYRYTVENSVYVAADAQRLGIGRRLLADLIERCQRLGFRQMVAVIGDSANAASISLHADLGFRRVGTIGSCGFKFGRWVDSVIMQRALGAGDRAPPDRGAGT
jgi:phosphinothricin acetyltransferase